MTTHYVTYKDVTLEVTGTFYNGFSGTRETPPEPREFEIEKVSINNANCTELLEDYIDEIEQLILETHYS